MRPGSLRESVIIQKNTPTTSSRGEKTDVWSTRAAVKAEVLALRGREYYQAQQVNAEAQFKVTIWYLDGVAAQDRIVWGDRTLEVISPAIDIGGKRIWMELMCRELNA